MHQAATTLLAILAVPLTCLAQALRDPLIGVVRDPDGRPVAGATVQVFRAGGRGTGMLDLNYKNDFRRVAVARTGKDGRFATHLPAGLSCRIVVDHAPHAIWLRDDRLPGDELEIQLQNPAKVSGKLTLADGKPAKARLRAWRRDTRDELFDAETAEDGTFVFERVAPGPAVIRIEPERAPAPDWQNVELVAGETHSCELQLEAGVLLTGRVTERGTGKPIANALIGEGWTLHRAVTTDANGRYELHGYGSIGYVDVHCVAKGFIKQVAYDRKQDDALPLDFALARGQTTFGRIVDAQGRPVPDAYVQAFGYAHNGTRHHDCIATTTDDEGRFRIDGLHLTVHHALVARKDGYAMVVHALPPEVGEGQRPTGEIVLPKPRIVRGVLLDPDGNPRPDTEVSIWGYNDDRHRLAPDGALAQRADQLGGSWGILDRYVGRRTGRTDHLGRFAFGDIPPGTFYLVASAPQLGRIAVGEEFVVPRKGPLPRIELLADR